MRILRLECRQMTSHKQGDSEKNWETRRLRIEASTHSLEWQHLTHLQRIALHICKVIGRLIRKKFCTSSHAYWLQWSWRSELVALVRKAYCIPSNKLSPLCPWHHQIIALESQASCIPSRAYTPCSRCHQQTALQMESTLDCQSAIPEPIEEGLLKAGSLICTAGTSPSSCRSPLPIFRACASVSSPVTKRGKAGIPEQGFTKSCAAETRKFHFRTSFFCIATVMIPTFSQKMQDATSKKMISSWDFILNCRFTKLTGQAQNLQNERRRQDISQEAWFKPACQLCHRVEYYGYRKGHILVHSILLHVTKRRLRYTHLVLAPSDEKEFLVHSTQPCFTWCEAESVHSSHHCFTWRGVDSGILKSSCFMSREKDSERLTLAVSMLHMLASVVGWPRACIVPARDRRSIPSIALRCRLRCTEELWRDIHGNCEKGAQCDAW